MKNLIKLASLIILFTLFSCGSTEEDYKSEPNNYYAKTDASEMFAGLEEASEEMAPTTSSPDNTRIGNTDNIKRKLIKTGDIEFETNNVAETNNNIKKIIKQFDGYIANESEDKYDYKNSQKIEIRLPAENFDLLLAEISKGVEKFDSKNIHVKDVTEEFVDIQARLKTKKELEARYIQLLSKARNVSEILNIEREIGNLRGDIESFEGRLKYLKDQVAFSTLDVYFYETIPFQYEHKFLEKFKNGFGNGWENLLYFVIGLINIWPFVLIIIVLVYFVRKKLKQRRLKKLEK
jgi:hypothetical protein